MTPTVQKDSPVDILSEAFVQQLKRKLAEAVNSKTQKELESGMDIEYNVPSDFEEDNVPLQGIRGTTQLMYKSFMTPKKQDEIIKHALAIE